MVHRPLNVGNYLRIFRTLCNRLLLCCQIDGNNFIGLFAALQQTPNRSSDARPVVDIILGRGANIAVAKESAGRTDAMLRADLAPELFAQGVKGFLRFNPLPF